MRIRAMRGPLAVTTALMLLVTIAAPLAAQERPEVAVTFELTLKGTAPASVAIGAFFSTCDYEGNCTDQPSGVGFCTSADMTDVHYGIPGFGPGPSPVCEGGMTYRVTVTRHAGDFVPYSFHMNYKDQDGREASKGLLKGTETPTDDIVISTAYDFGDSDEQEESEIPEAPPNLGGGGMSANAPTGDARGAWAAALSALWLCVWAAASGRFGAPQTTLATVFMRRLTVHRGGGKE